MNRTFIIRSLPVILATIFLASCHSGRGGMPTAEVPVVSVSTADIPVTMDFVGQTYGKSDIQIEARVNGYLNGIYFAEGTAVRRGELLYIIEPAPLKTQVAEANARLADAHATRIQAQRNFNRIKPLAEVNAVSKSELDAATASLASAEAAVESARSGLAYSKIQLGYTEVRSPIDGIIGRTNAKIGAYVGQGSGVSVLNTVSQIDTIEVLFYIPDTRFRELKSSGNREVLSNITLLNSDGSEYPHRGRFDFVGRAVDPSTSTIDVQVSFPNPDSLLRPGQFARVRATVDTLRGAMLVPQRSVVQVQDAYSVYVVGSDGVVASRPVSVGPTRGTDWVVLHGLTAGETVIVEGFHKVRPGEHVKTVPYTSSHQTDNKK